MIDEVLALPMDLKKVSHTKVVSVTLDADTAMVMQRYDMTKEKLGQDGNTHTVVFWARSRDIWVRHGETWRMRETRTNELDMSMDGVNVLHKTRKEI